MTAQCGGGTSSPKPGIPQNVAVSGALITEGLTMISPWLIPFAGYIDGFLFQSVNQCSADPPAMPVFDASDVANLIGGVFNPNLNVTLAKINNALLNYFWDKFCQCDTAGAGPPALTPIPQPPGVALTQPQVAAACFTGSAEYTPEVTDAPSTGPYTLPDLTQALVPVDGRTATYTGGSTPITVYGMPSTVTRIDFQSFQPSSQLEGLNCGSTMAWCHFYSAALAALTSHQFSGPQYTQSNTSGTFAPPANASFWSVAQGWNQTTCGAPLGTARIKTQVYCSGAGPGVLANCCPPDPSVSIGINAIIDALKNLSVNLATPSLSAFQTGATHGPLTGSGQFVLTGKPLALHVNVTAYGPAQGTWVGDPNRFSNLGWITPEIAGNPYAPQRLSFLSQQIQLPQLVDVINFSLGPGVHANVTELIGQPPGVLFQT